MKNVLLIASAFICIASASIGQTLPNYLPADGLVGWWPFNGNANDESGNGNDGVVNGTVSLTTDKNGIPNSAYSFPGINNSFIDINQNASFSNFNDGITLSVWYLSYANQIDPGYHPRVIELGYTGTSGFGARGFPETGISLHYNSNYSAGYWWSEGALNQSLNTWYHLVLTVNFASNTWVAFHNGVQILSGTGNGTSTSMNLSGFDFEVGRKPISQDGGWDGKVDDIAIYNRALSQEEITALYTGEPVNPPTACNPLPSNLQNGLVGYWPFCGNANDESGNGNDGTVNGATLSEDRFGLANAAYDFDGVNGYIEVPDNSSLQLTNNYTINGWFKADAFFLTNNNDRRIISKVEPSGWYGGYEVFIGGSTNDIAHTGNIGGNNFVNGSSGYSINTWYMFSVTYAGVVSKLYMNGVLVNSQLVQGSLQTSNLPLLFGKIAGNNGYFDGIIDDIGIWNRALTSEEVQQLYTLNACTFSIYDTTYVTIYDTVSVSTTDTLIINTLITGVQPAQENTFLVYPNPAGSQITINNGNVSILGGYTMRISNSIGQEVYNQNITQTEVTLDLSNWGGNGLYVLYILDPQGEIIAVKQIMLQ